MRLGILPPRFEHPLAVVLPNIANHGGNFQNLGATNAATPTNGVSTYRANGLVCFRIATLRVQAGLAGPGCVLCAGGVAGATYH